MIELILARVLASMNKEWAGSHLRLFLLETRMPWFPELAVFEQSILRPADLKLFLDRSEGIPRTIRDEEKMAWAVPRLRSCAQGGIFFCDGRQTDR